MIFKNSQIQSMGIEIKIVVLFSTDWEGNKKMFHVLIHVLVTQVHTYVKIIKYSKFIYFTTYEIGPQNIIIMAKQPWELGIE